MAKIRSIAAVEAQPLPERWEKTEKAPQGLEKIAYPGRLFIWPSAGPSFEKLVHYLRRSDHCDFHRQEATCFVLHMRDGCIDPLVARLQELLSPEELQAIRALYMPSEQDPGLADFPRVGTLRQFMTLTQCGWLVDMLVDRRVTSHYQPIVDANDTSKVYAQEALFRGLDPDGKLVPPFKILSLARDAGMMVQVDATARRCAFEGAGRQNIQSYLFVNFSPNSFIDPGYSLGSTMSTIRKAGLSPDRVVFEITEADKIQDLPHLMSVLSFYRHSGFRVALDDLGSGYSSLNLVHQLRPDLVKLDMELVRDVHCDPYKAIIAQKLLELTSQLGIETVAEGVETREELDWVRSHGATYVQGYLIARPSAELVTETPRVL